jgi:sortase A
MVKISLRKIEAVLLGIGLVLLATFLAFRIHSLVASRAALRKFAATNALVAKNSKVGLQKVDSSLWSEQRIEAYKQTLAVKSDDPIAVVDIPRLSLEVPVFEGTDELVLTRGLGRIKGTARPGENGNIGIAGHRDGFFRSLKDIQIGDRIELATLKGKTTYVVEGTEIVSPDDVSVLEPRGHPVLTLVTCYPFYFVGHAPQRYIVHASIAEQDLPDNRKSTTEVRIINKQEATK